MSSPGARRGAFPSVSHPPATPQDRYAGIVAVLLGESEVTHALNAAGSKQTFGSSALKIRGKIFAMLVKDRFVVKLPRQRVDALVSAGDGERFDPGHGRLMKEWLAVAPTSDVEWLPLAREAMAFVASKR